MTGFGLAWLKFQIRSGAVALELRQAGHGWRAIAEQLHLGTETGARRCVALFLSADLASRESAQAGAGAARGRGGADALGEIERSAAGAE